MGGMHGTDIHPCVIVIHLLGPPGLSGLMTIALHGHMEPPTGPVGSFNLPPAAHLPPPPAPTPSTAHPLYVQSVHVIRACYPSYYSSCEKSYSKSSSAT